MKRRHFLPLTATAVASTALGYYAWDQAVVRTARHRANSAPGRYLSATTLAANQQQVAHDAAQQELAPGCAGTAPMCNTTATA
ncbi:hypothetical protein [Hymenobacter psychrophilus]|uniref:Uncharacterized protein n=1 Tax=Hymenobacter psychrophilus TaxID=651662 RepID=A0A1H3L818_9BACT|nr:hypothetical protein [Hymenobacter psychrophilus]SDY60088.1 hypothetical protein SAMN04488069_110130 [Hymenobacter psychrophilus]